MPIADERSQRDQPIEDEAPLRWSSTRAFILSTSAAAIGLGNLWRFPYLAGENGGGAFILAYLIAVVAIAVPIMILEIGAGKFVLGSPVATFRAVHPRASIVGWLVVLLTVIITSYYLVITGWTLGYAADSVRGAVSPFEEFTSGYASLWYFLVVSVLVAGVLLAGLAGIERLATYLVPILLVAVVVLVVYGFTLEGRGEAVRFMFAPDFARLAEPQLWLLAVGQAFYSLAIGQGYLITYGSYLPLDVNVPRASIIVAMVETSVALLAGLMIFPLVFAFDLQPDEGTQLAFNTLPRAFNSLGPGIVLAAVFFPLLFLAAFSSSIAGMKVVVNAVQEEMRLTARQAVLVTFAVLTVLGIPSALSFGPVELSMFGTPFIEVVDRVGATQIVVASGLIGATLFAWFVPRERFEDALHDWRLPWARVVVGVGRVVPFGAALVLGYALFQGTVG